MAETDLLKIYQVVIRPVLEYATPTFHPMLTKEMTKNIECIQKRVSKIIFGWDSSYTELLSEEKLQLLEERRHRLTDNFAKKVLASEKGPEWFPLRPNTGHDTRNNGNYLEQYAKTERLRKSPLYHMRRRLNDLNM